MILSLPALSRDGFQGNAHGCRQYPEALELLNGLRLDHKLPHLVVIALGANGEINRADVEQALATIGRGRLLALMTPRQLGGWAGANAQLVRAEAISDPERIIALDWVAYSSGHPSWFQPDGLHLTLSGAAAFASLIDRVLPVASPPSPVREARCAPVSLPAHGDLPGVTTTLRGDDIRMGPKSHDVQVTLSNANAFPVHGVADVRLAGAMRVPVASSCVTVPAQGTTAVTLRVESQAGEDVEFLGRYRADLGFRLQGPEGQTATIASSHMLVPTNTGARRSLGAA